MVKTTLNSTLLAAIIILVALGSRPLAAQTGDSLLTADTTVVSFIVETRHRLYPNFRQTDTVGLDQPFLIGEEELEARIVSFNPHLGITTDGQRLQMSDTLYNPAIQVEVRKDGEITQTSWGFFYVDAPHFYRDHMLGFRLLAFNVGNRYVPNPNDK